MNESKYLAKISYTFIYLSFQNANEAVILNYQQNMHDAISIMYKLQTGIDVNVKFTGYEKLFCYFDSFHNEKAGQGRADRRITLQLCFEIPLW